MKNNKKGDRLTERLYIKELHPILDGGKGDKKVTAVYEHNSNCNEKHALRGIGIAASNDATAGKTNP